MSDTPSAVLFCCDHNSIRSPMAEGLMKNLVGTKIFIQSAGVKGDNDVDGFAVAVCKELDVELSKHKSRSFEELEDWGDRLDSFDLVIALSPTSHRRIAELTKNSAVDVEYWETADPTGSGENREDKLAAYRAVRDDIIANIKKRFLS
ncbi:low molecular weight phosphatase family protein [Amylibacter sp. SFDW26]|uniref:arsenate-mycothiol transferase ArsC n=1 Tax=Amylibacter sp. SFDW26 TaxID=2652722 RepID=UPI001262044D|nr:low molecular weight phosphatase family protein [Amylibacter sp. SFDW26]KAB7613500.1 low molecular weight phosphatase family protein [Amylibacter sp. SFDW26]